MTQTLNFIKQKHIHFIVCLVWIALWIVPWGKLPSFQGNIFLVFITDMLRLGIALVIFIIPGALLYILLRQKEDRTGAELPGIIPIGFAFSVFFVAVIGFAGRVLGQSFNTVKYTFALVGFVELLLMMFVRPDYSFDKNEVIQSLRSAFRNPPLVLAFILVTLMSFHDNLFFIDDTTYLAYLTNWQHSGQLGFRNIVHEIDVAENFRFWLALYPMGQALLADLSGLPGLLLVGNYLEPFLIILATITSYWFARVLGLSRKASGFAILIQITLYAWLMGDQFPVGMWFYQSLAEDKVTAAFLLAPVFFVFSLAYIQNSTRKKLLLVILTGICLTLTHPVILFYSASIVGFMGIFALVIKKNEWRAFFQLVIAVASVMLPYLLIRISDYHAQTNIPYDATSASESFQIERYTYVLNDVFYGLNPGVLKFIDFEIENDKIYPGLQVFRSIPIFIVLLAGGVALLNLKSGPLYWYISSCMLLIAVATVPYTGWILGYFVSARLISRASWFSPLGIGSVIILQLGRNWLKTRGMFPRITTNIPNGNLLWVTTGLMACFIFVSPLLFYHFLPRVPAYFEVLKHNKQLAQIGAYIDQNTSKSVTVVSLDYQDMQLLPGVSANTKLISFREEKPYNGFNGTLSLDEIKKRTDASNAIISLDQNVSFDERCASIKKYNVRYVLAQINTVDTFYRLIEKCNTKVQIELETDNLVLLSLSEY